MAIRARLTDRYGAFFGYCDIPAQSIFPEVLVLVTHVTASGTAPGREPSVLAIGVSATYTARAFARYPRGDSVVSIREIVPAYREASFSWATNFKDVPLAENFQPAPPTKGAA
jgi:hypothetical protein